LGVREIMKRMNQAPLWLRRLDLVKSELMGARFPRTAEEGLRQVAALSAVSLRMLEEDVRATMPRADRKRVRKALCERLARISRVEAQWMLLWKRERARYFRS
jgi:hypothetical protein